MTALTGQQLSVIHAMTGEMVQAIHVLLKVAETGLNAMESDQPEITTRMALERELGHIAALTMILCDMGMVESDRINAECAMRLIELTLASIDRRKP